MKEAKCLTQWDSQGNQVWDAVNDTVFTTIRGCGGGGYQQSYILKRNSNESIPNVNKIRTMSHDLFSTRFGEDGKANTLARTDYKEPPIVVWQKENSQMEKMYVLRRLTPMECSRLQGFPDWWTDGVEGSDSNKYKMWGNGIALPCAADVLGRIAKAIRDEQETN